jgi:hypothetical protein
MNKTTEYIDNNGHVWRGEWSGGLFRATNATQDRSDGSLDRVTYDSIPTTWRRT